MNVHSILCLLALATLGPACSLRSVALDRVADSLAQGGGTFASDDDPELIRDAAPFSLKLTESILEERPQHRGLLLAAARGFTQYAYAFLDQRADESEARDLGVSLALRERARGLYLRAREFGLRGLDVSHAGMAEELRHDPRAALRSANAQDVPLLYWTAASWGAFISHSKDRPEIIADQPAVEALLDRALELDEAFEAGAIHSLLIGYEQSRLRGVGDPIRRARSHFDRAVKLSHDELAGPFVSLAENVTVPLQTRAEFEKLLHHALAIDPAARPEWRLANRIAQDRARWLLAKEGDLFVE